MDEIIKQETLEYLEIEKNATENSLPEKSKDKYVSIYNKFMEWKEQKNESFSENTLITYFNELSLSFKSSTLWAQYSMLKSTLNIYHNINLETYTKLLAFIKDKNIGFKSKKSKVLTANEVEEFLNKAPNDKYLATKVSLIFGINGSCGREELCNIYVKDVKMYDNSMILVKLPHTKRNIERSFTITDNYYKIVDEYMKLRPNNAKSDRFFLNYQNGKCTQQPIGINKFGKMPKEIATYLNLPDSDHYTGHSFRRTSATLLPDARANLLTLKRHRSWKSNQVTEEYIEDSIGNKQKISKKIEENIVIKSEEYADDPLSDAQNQYSEYNETFETVDVLPAKIRKVSQNIIKEEESSSDNEDGTKSTTSNMTFPTENLTINNVTNCSNISFNVCKH